MATPIMNERKWRAESDVRTLQEAKQIQADKGRLAAAKAAAKRELRDLNAIVKTAPKGRKK